MTIHKELSPMDRFVFTFISPSGWRALGPELKAIDRHLGRDHSLDAKSGEGYGERLKHIAAYDRGEIRIQNGIIKVHKHLRRRKI